MEINASPKFKKLPPNFICNNAPLIFDHGATDRDGDSLCYSVIVPFSGGTSANNRPIPAMNPPYSKFLMRTPFNSNNIMNGSIKLQINSITGILKVTPNEIGQFVVAILVEEFRNGQKIGEIFRDYLLNVIDCQFSALANFDFKPINCNRQVNFINKSLGDNIKYHWNFGVINEESDTSIIQNPSWNYKNYGDYEVALIVEADGCNDTIYKSITINNPDTIPSINGLSPKVGCDSLTLFIADQTNADSFLWNFGDGIVQLKNSDFKKYFYEKDGDYIVTLEIFDTNNCSVYSPLKDTIKVLKRKLHHANFDISFKKGCESDGIVEIIWDSISSNKYIWNFEKGGQQLNKTPKFYKYDLNGEYRISLKTIDTNFCVSNDSSSIVFYLDDFSSNLNNIQLYNVFTPNFDSYNSMYCLDVESLKCLKLNYYIYNRYGNIVFEGNSIHDCWDGTNQSNGIIVPEGEYFGVFFFSSLDGKDAKLSNVITVRR